MTLFANCCCFIFLVVLGFGITLISLYGVSMRDRMNLANRTMTPLQQKNMEIIGDVEFRHIANLVLENPRGVVENPFPSPDKQKAIANLRREEDELVCIARFVDKSNIKYRLETVSASNLPEDDAQVFINHKGRCGVCSSLSDFPTFARVYEDIPIPVYRLDYYYCTVQGLLSETLGRQCFANTRISLPCADLLYKKATFGFKSCFWKCFDSNEPANCIRSCDDEETGPTFATIAGRHFEMDNSVVLVSKLPRMDEKVLAAETDVDRPELSQAVVSDLLEKVLVNPMTAIEADVYGDFAFETALSPSAVCAAKFNKPTNKEYVLATFSSKEEAVSSGAVITHTGECGLCSSLQDLATYSQHFNLPKYLTSCALRSVLGESVTRSCVKSLGFTDQCASIIAKRLVHTRQKCAFACVLNYFAEYNYLGKGLNPCLTCDEQMSGPVFKKVAGRTNRNSGLSTKIRRISVEMSIIEHVYPKTEEGSAPSESAQKSSEGKDEL